MKKIFIAGHQGMVGGAICCRLGESQEFQVVTRSRAQLDLCDQRAVLDFMRAERPDEVILAAAKVGGIYANQTYPAEFIYENIQLQANLIHSAHLVDVQKLLFLGSSCIYPRNASQPIKEEALLTGLLEATNEPYAMAKISGIKLCESYNRQYGRDYRCVMPTNLYGPGDNYHKENSHVVPALLRRFHDAKENQSKEVVVWGSGTPKREFLYVDDMAEASLFVHNLDKAFIDECTSPMTSHINVGSGADISIGELARLIKETVGFKGDVVFDSSKPDGSPRKLLDVSLLKNLGWTATTSLKAGLRHSYLDFLSCNIRK